MKENRERAQLFIMEREGVKITNDPNDRGGLTAAYGLTLATMKRLNLDLNQDGLVDAKDVGLVTRETIDRVFRTHFWDAIDGDNLPGGIDLIAADISWNSGPGKWRQFQKEGYGTDIEKLTARRIEFYEHLAEKDPSQIRFLKGWKNRANAALEEARKCVGA